LQFFSYIGAGGFVQQFEEASQQLDYMEGWVGGEFDPASACAVRSSELSRVPCVCSPTVLSPLPMFFEN